MWLPVVCRQSRVGHALRSDNIIVCHSEQCMFVFGILDCWSLAFGPMGHFLLGLRNYELKMHRMNVCTHINS